MSDPAERAAQRIVLDIGISSKSAMEVAHIIRAEYDELMPCGHPRACWIVSIVPAPYGADPDSIPPEYALRDGRCTACEREASAVEAARESIFKFIADNLLRGSVHERDHGTQGALCDQSSIGSGQK